MLNFFNLSIVWINISRILHLMHFFSFLNSITYIDFVKNNFCKVVVWFYIYLIFKYLAATSLRQHLYFTTYSLSLSTLFAKNFNFFHLFLLFFSFFLNNYSGCSLFASFSLTKKALIVLYSYIKENVFVLPSIVIFNS
jgi:hypothetical protein